MPTYFAGILNLRGKIVSTIDLKKSLGNFTASKAQNHTQKPCVLITEFEGHLFGAIVDDIVEVLSVTLNDIDTGAENMCIDGSYRGIIKISDRPLAPILNLESSCHVKDLIQAKVYA